MSEARDRWITQWTVTDRRGREARDVSAIVPALCQHYRSLSAADRLEVNTLLTEWVASTEWATAEARNQWFTALALIDEFHITSAVPVVRRLIGQLAQKSAPQARAWRQQIVQQVLPRLASDNG